MSQKLRKEFNVNGVQLAVVMDFGSMRETLEDAMSSWEPGEFTEAYTVDSGNVSEVDYMADIQKMRDLLLSIENAPTVLTDYVEQVRKKRNGDFWSRSGVTIFRCLHVSEYHTDFTNSWNILQLRLEVVDAKTCRLTLVYKFETL